MELQFVLEKKDIEESLLCSQWRREGRRKRLHLLLLSLLGAFCLVVYRMDTTGWYALFMAGIVLGLMFLLLYWPLYRRRQQAAKWLEASGGSCRLQLPAGPVEEAFSSEGVYTLRREGRLYCIPKRCLTAPQRAAVERLVHQAEHSYEVTTEKRKKAALYG